jgi:hypothetical protein
MPSVPVVRLPVDGAGKAIRTVRPPGYDDGSGGPVEQEVDSLAYQDGSSTDADLQKLRNLDIALSALRTAVSGGKSLADVVTALATVISVTGVVSVSNFPADQLVHANALPLPTGAARDSTLSALATDATLGTRLKPGDPVTVAALDVPLSTRLKPGDSVQVSNFPPAVADSLTSRMRAHTPTAGYVIWEETGVFASGAAGFWYICEAPLGQGANSGVHRGVRVAVDANANISGTWQEGTAITWATKAGTWV